MSETTVTEPKLYKKKPVEVWTIRWDGGASEATPVIDWILGGGGTARYVGRDEDHHLRTERLDVAEFIVIDTLEGPHRMHAGDIAIRGVAGEHYPCKPDIFEQTYEAA